MPSIFISYRRSDSQADSGRIYDRLVAHFGNQAIFKDVDDVPPGVDFRAFLRDTLSQCQVLLAVIGPTWINATDHYGRRLDNAGDWVRLEIEEALKSQDTLVVPVLVNNAHIPRADELPNSLKDLAYRNKRDVRPDPDFNKDMNRLIIGLEQHIEQTRKAIKPATPEANESSKQLEQYRQEIRQYLEEDRGNLTPFSRSILNEFRASFGLTVEAATTIEQEELKPYRAKEEAIGRYQKVFSDALQYENPISEGK
jgi:hypothetical protein